MQYLRGTCLLAGAQPAGAALAIFSRDFSSSPVRVSTGGHERFLSVACNLRRWSRTRPRPRPAAESGQRAAGGRDGRDRLEAVCSGLSVCTTNLVWYVSKYLCTLQSSWRSQFPRPRPLSRAACLWAGQMDAPPAQAGLASAACKCVRRRRVRCSAGGLRREVGRCVCGRQRSGQQAVPRHGHGQHTSSKSRPKRDGLLYFLPLS